MPSAKTFHIAYDCCTLFSDVFKVPSERGLFSIILHHTLPWNKKFIAYDRDFWKNPNLFENYFMFESRVTFYRARNSLVTKNLIKITKLMEYLPLAVYEYCINLSVVINYVRNSYLTIWKECKNNAAIIERLNLALKDLGGLPKNKETKMPTVEEVMTQGIGVKKRKAKNTNKVDTLQSKKSLNWRKVANSLLEYHKYIRGRSFFPTLLINTAKDLEFDAPVFEYNFKLKSVFDVLIKELGHDCLNFGYVLINNWQDTVIACEQHNKSPGVNYGLVDWFFYHKNREFIKSYLIEHKLYIEGKDVRHGKKRI